MRTPQANIDTLLLASKTAEVRLTFRRRKLVFTSQSVTDSEGQTDPANLDASQWGSAVVRVANGNGNSLHVQRILNLASNPSTWSTWMDIGVDLKAGSRPGVHGERFWYQKANGVLCYRDFSTIATEHEVTTALTDKVAGLAPVDAGVYAYTLPDPSTLSFPGELKGMFGRIAFIAPNGELIPWSGIVYGDISTPRYVDAVTLGGIDYIYVMDRAAGRVVEVTRQGNSWSYAKYIVPIDAIDNITGVTLRYATVIKNQVFVNCRVVNSSDNNVPVSMDAIIFGPAIYDPGILDSHDCQNYSFSRWSYLTSENIGGKLIVPGNGSAYYLGATKLFTSVATILVGEDSIALKHVTSDMFALALSEQENTGAQLSLQLAHDADYPQVLDDVVFEFGYNGEYTQMGIFTIHNIEEAGAFGLLQHNQLAYTSSYGEIILFTPHQSYYIASQDKITTNPATMMDVVVSRGLFGKVAV